MARLTHRFEGRMDDDLLKALDAHVEKSGETRGEVFRKAMSLYIRAKRDKNTEVIIRDKTDRNKIVELTGL